MTVHSINYLLLRSWQADATSLPAMHMSVMSSTYNIKVTYPEKQSACLYHNEELIVTTSQRITMYHDSWNLRTNGSRWHFPRRISRIFQQAATLPNKDNLTILYKNTALFDNTTSAWFTAACTLHHMANNHSEIVLNLLPLQ